MGKKKGNPNGILEWIVDFFVTPIANAIKHIIENPKELIKTAAPLTWIHDIIRRLAPAIATVEKDIAPDKVKSPSSAAEIASKVMNDADKGLEDMTTAAMTVETLSFGLVDVTVDRATRLPAPRFLDTVATGIREEKLMSGFLPFYRRHILKQYQPILPEQYRLAMMRAKNLVSHVDYVSAMSESGLNYEWAMRWASEQEAFPLFDTLIEMLRRGFISESDFYYYMERQAVGAYQAAQMIGLRDVIPPLTDLIRMAVREAFGDHSYEAQYPEYEKYAGMMGLSKYFASAYWYAHWERIPLTQMYENLWREHWKTEDFMRMLRIRDVHPDDRDAILRVAYRPPDLRTLGYGYDTGKMEREFIEEMFKWRGVDPAIRSKVVDSFVAYRTSAERESVRRELLWAYSHEKITEKEFRATLKAPPLETRDEMVDLWVMRGNFQLERFKVPEVSPEYRIITSSEALWAFKNGLHDEKWLRARLGDLDWTQPRVDLAVQRAKKELEPAPPPPVTVRYLTSAQLRSLYEAAMIGKEVLAKRLNVELGYTIEDSKMLADLWSIPVEKAPPKPYTDTWSRRLYAYRISRWDEVYSNYLSLGYDEEHAWNMVLATILAEEYPALSASFRKGYINQETFLAQLYELGMEFEDANELLERTIRDFTYERLESERDVTKAEIVKGVKNNLLTVNEGVYLLQDLGYEEWEALFILEVNKIVVAGDPEGYWEMRRVTELYKKASGQPYVDIPERVVDLEKHIKQARRVIEDMRKEEASSADIAEEQKKVGELEYQLRALLISHKLQRT